MADVAVPVHSQTQTGFTVVDRQHGAGSRQHASANQGGRDVGRAEQGDSITYTWNDAHRPGVAPSRLGRRVADHGHGPDHEQRATTTGSASAVRPANLNFGIVYLQQNYVPGTGTSPARRSRCSATPSRWCSGTPSGAGEHRHRRDADHMAGITGAYDAAGNACSTATITGSGSPRIDF